MRIKLDLATGWLKEYRWPVKLCQQYFQQTNKYCLFVFIFGFGF